MITCGQVAFIQALFGVGFPSYSVPVPYMKALFEEERLPFREGWRRRKLWSVGLIESLVQILRLLLTSMKRLRQDRNHGSLLSLYTKDTMPR